MGYLISRLSSGLSGLLTETPVEHGGGPIEGPVGTYASDVLPPARRGAGVSAIRALGLPAAFRSIEISAGVASGLTLVGEVNGRALVKQPALVVKPDPWREFSEWVERFVVSMAVDGNVFLDLRNREIAAPILDPFLTRERWVKGRKSYTTYDHRLGRFVDLKDSEVHHVWGLQLPGRTRGLGPIEACRLSLSGALDVRDYAATWFQTDDIPSGVLSSDQHLDPDSIRIYREVWANPGAYDAPDAETLNRRLGPTVRVLGKGLKYSPIMLKPADAQWIEAQQFGILDIARMFGVPADYVLAAVEGKSMTYANLEMIDTQFMRLTLLPKYLRKIETAITALLPPGQTARFDLADYLRPDAKTRAEVDKIYLDAGVISPQFVHDREKFGGVAPGRPSQPAPAANDREDAPA